MLVNDGFDGHIEQIWGEGVLHITEWCVYVDLQEWGTSFNNVPVSQAVIAWRSQDSRWDADENAIWVEPESGNGDRVLVRDGDRITLVGEACTVDYISQYDGDWVAGFPISEQCPVQRTFAIPGWVHAVDSQ